MPSPLPGMRGRRVITCWNCETCLPADAFEGQRCPLCRANNHLHPLFLLLALTFVGVVLGWLGGVVFGLFGLLAGWGVDPLTAASTGALLTAALFGLVGAGLAVFVMIDNFASVRDPELINRGADVKRQRQRATAARPPESP